MRIQNNKLKPKKSLLTFFKHGENDKNENSDFCKMFVSLKTFYFHFQP